MVLAEPVWKLSRLIFSSLFPVSNPCKPITLGAVSAVAFRRLSAAETVVSLLLLYFRSFERAVDAHTAVELSAFLADAERKNFGRGDATLHLFADYGARLCAFGTVLEGDILYKAPLFEVLLSMLLGKAD